MSVEIGSITTEHIEALVTDHVEGFARVRFVSLRCSSPWLAGRDERESERSPMEDLKLPRVPGVPVPVLSAESLRELRRRRRTQ
jgi:hypothetical protein